MLRSMTGFASATGSLPPHSWSWELRSVNGKGQDVRLRVPDWISGLEIELRKKLTKSTWRGNITLSLRLTRAENDGSLQLNTCQVDAVLQALAEIENRALDAGVSLAPSRAADVAGIRGVLDVGSSEDAIEPLSEQLLTEVDTLIEAFNTMREGEGAAVKSMLLNQLTEIEDLTQQAASLASAREDQTKQVLKRNLARIIENADGIDENRLAQELAMLFVKSDVTEEIDRLGAHIDAARKLISQGGSVGRKLDFLMQEFNREANTLCAKAQNSDLTACGLALKTVVDRMREQVQNVE